MSAVRRDRATRAGALGASAAVALTLGVAVPGAASAAGAPSSTPAPAAALAAQVESGSRFTLAVLPDTQCYSRYSADQFVPRYGTDPFQVQTEWLVENADELNIPFVVHVGDVVDRENQAQEWTAASRAMGVLEDGGLGYSILPGNHDVADQGVRSAEWNSPRYLANFATNRVSENPGFVDSFQNGLGTAYTFEAQGETFMSLALPWNADQSVYAWAQGVLDAHPEVPVVLSSHAIIGVQSDQITPADFWFGEELWDRLISGNDQIFMTLNGHFHGATQRTRINDAGNEVYQILMDYQMAAHGGNGYLSLIEMDFASGSIDVETVSPWITKKLPEDVTRDDSPYLTGQWQSFSLPVDFADRFAGFAPYFAPADDDLGNLSQRAREIVSEGWDGAPPEAIEAPGAREDHVAVEGTVAHWRFGDQPEGAVAENASITDEAGTSPMHRLPLDQTDAPDELEDIAISRSDVHAFSSDGAAACFANASRVTGRTSYLLTEFGAPVTNVDLNGGYTIESFLKLDDTWTADDNRWSAALTRAGRRSALPTQWSADHESSPAFLSVSNLREFQWGTIPGQEWGYSSSLWSGEILLDSWHHVAVVNDPVASTTIMYVDGVPVLRNATGLDGMLFNADYPWVLGASWARDEPSHGWNGCVGETRIVDRAITPAEFLIERADIDTPFALTTVVEASNPADFELTRLEGRGAPGSQVHVAATQHAGDAMFAAAAAPQVVTVGDDGAWSAELDAPVAGAGQWSVSAVPAMGTRTGDGAELTFAIVDAGQEPEPELPGEAPEEPGQPGTPGAPGGPTPGDGELPDAGGTGASDDAPAADGSTGASGGGLAATGVTVTAVVLAAVLLALGVALRTRLRRRESLTR